MKAGIFVGPEIRKLMLDDSFQIYLSTVELTAWESFKSVTKKFLGNFRHEQYARIVEDMLKVYKKMRCHMSLKIHFLHSHLDFFPHNLRDVSDEQGERFQQDISVIESCYQGCFNANIIGDYC